MGFFQKLKDFGSKVVRGVRKGWDFVRDKVAPVIRKAIPIANSIADNVPVISPAVHTITNLADKGLKFIGR